MICWDHKNPGTSSQTPSLRLSERWLIYNLNREPGSHQSRPDGVWGNLILKTKRIFICFEDKCAFPGPGREEIVGLLHVRDWLLKSCLKHSEVSCERRCSAPVWTRVLVMFIPFVTLCPHSDMAVAGTVCLTASLPVTLKRYCISRKCKLAGNPVNLLFISNGKLS